MFERLVNMGLPFVRLNYQVCFSAYISSLIFLQDQSLNCRHLYAVKDSKIYISISLCDLFIYGPYFCLFLSIV